MNLKKTLPVLILALFGCQGCFKKTDNKNTYNSIVFTEYGSAAYSKEQNKKYIELSKATGFNTASILFTCHVPNISSSEIDCISNNSPKLERVEAFMKQAKSQKLALSLRVYIDVLSGEWRALWNPENKKKAFTEIEKKLVKFAKVAQTHKVEMFIIGAELEKLTRPEFTTEWIKIIKSVRSHYKGKLSYGANGNYSSYKKPEYKWVGFWDHLDAVGIDYYAPLTSTKVTGKSLSEHHCKKMSALQNIYSDKNIFINEVGFPAAENGHTKPYAWIWPKGTKNNFEKQALNISSFFKCLEDKKVLGVSVWRYLNNERSVYPHGYILDEEPTKKALKDGLARF